MLFSVGLVFWQVISQSQSIELSGPPYRTTLEPNLPPSFTPRLLFLTPDPAASPPSACNIHLGECCHDETHSFNAYKHTAPGSFHSISHLPSNQSCFSGVKV